MKFQYSTSYPSLFATLRGRNGAVREYRCLISDVSEYSVVPRVDAYWLGYPEASHGDPVTTPSNLVLVATSTGYAQGMMIIMQEVKIGSIEVKDVPFLALDISQVVSFDVVLGRNFFQKGLLRIEHDFVARSLTLSQTGEGRPA
jgi:hypothetical protein